MYLFITFCLSSYTQCTNKPTVKVPIYSSATTQVRAANIVRAGESLMKLISELKTLLILNDFPQVNKYVKDRNTECERISNIIMEKMVRIGEEGNMANHNLLSVLDATK